MKESNSKKTSKLEVVYRVLAHGKLGWLIYGLFVLQSGWLALTAIYPLPFDEYYHVGVTKIYASQWSPFIAQQPASASIFGDITREPSYLFHYLLSFPYRLIDNFLHNPTAQIIALRFLNIAMVLVGLILFNKLLQAWKIPRRIINFVLLVFILTPIVPFLAAHSNYDNMMFMLTPVYLLLATKLINQEKFNIPLFGLFLSVGMLTSLVKYSFLPILVIVGALVLFYRLRMTGFSWRAFTQSAVVNGLYKKGSLVAISFLLVISVGLFAERYGRNIIQYGDISPDCAKVQSVKTCEDFMPWARNRRNKQNKPADQEFGNPASFSQHWITKMGRGYFALFSHTPTLVVSSQEPFGPIVAKPLLPLPVNVAIGALSIGLISLAVTFKKIWSQRWLQFSLVIVGFFLIILWGFNYLTYLNLGSAQAIQARYTYPVLILGLTVLVYATNLAIKSRQIKGALASLILILYFWGGGIAGWLIRADPTWYWQNHTVTTINQQVQRVLNRTVIH